ncbi:ribosome maturation factor RimP [Agathobacter ruminis]|uniref:Ribosome maturation factor RimP n=1 Tax=Agathobacter ruminis TaxID=1712665 RepID=A0A2G3E4T9_9FIRM|nr:ribosome maturation factor RimP [Agathobacter ruminis]MDC7302588.1 ribosome maturation factor RimP [Agathobacter ruminis]PHU38279.1 ribosome maturation factor RimP [Agathobacter ruminis]
MSKAADYAAKAEQLVTPILEENHFELVDAEFVKEAGNYYLRLYIDKEGGITVDDCEIVSRAMDPLLEKEDFIPEAYIFEVSSPGLGRPLKKERDYVRNMGKDVEIRTYKAIDHCKEFTGTLKEYDENSVTITIGDEDKTFFKNEIALIRQAIDF